MDMVDDIEDEICELLWCMLVMGFEIELELEVFLFGMLGFFKL